MNISYLLFDLDNTLYPESSGMQQEIHNRMTEFVISFLKIAPEEATKARRLGFLNHGTTLRWLQMEHGLENILDFFEKVHPQDVENLIPAAPELNILLESLPYPKAVFTNSPSFHAHRVLTHLGIAHHFTHLFDITFNELQGKPHQTSYERVLQSLAVPAEQTVFIDDAPSYVQGFIDLHGVGILIDEFNKHGDFNGLRIQNIYQLPDILQTLSTNPDSNNGFTSKS